MMKKSLIIAILALLFTGTAFAEQPRAAAYREMLAAGKFYIEYSRVAEYADPKLQKRSDKNSERTREIFVADGGKRAILSMGGRYGNAMAMQMESAQSVCKLFRNAARNAAAFRDEMKLDYLYKDGKYYQFFGKNKALCLSEVEAKDVHADPLADWHGVVQTLAAPGFLAPFVLGESEDARFAGSGTETIFGQTMPTDTYLVRIKDKNGSTAGMEYAYNYYYDETGELRYISVKVAANGNAQNAGTAGSLRGKGSSIGTYIRVDQFVGTIPQDMFAYPKDCKVYSILPGSLHDLFGYGELVEVEKE